MHAIPVCTLSISTILCEELSSYEIDPNDEIFWHVLLCWWLYFFTFHIVSRSRNTVVGILARARAGRPWNRSSIAGRCNKLLSVWNLLTGSNQPHFQWVPGSFPGVKRICREAYHSPDLVPKVKNTWSYTSTQPYVFRARTTTKYNTEL
jgi:hypothetical protein